MKKSNSKLVSGRNLYVKTSKFEFGNEFERTQAKTGFIWEFMIYQIPLKKKKKKHYNSSCDGTYKVIVIHCAHKRDLGEGVSLQQ